MRNSPMFKIEIETTNAAFGEEPDEATLEVARILEKLVQSLRFNPLLATARSLYDHNGNRVGYARWEDD